MGFNAKLFVPAGERRRSDRQVAQVLGAIHRVDAEPIDVVMHDISQHGFRCEGDLDLQVGDELVVDLDEVGSSVAVVRWCDGREIGGEFLIPLSRVRLAAVLG